MHLNKFKVKKNGKISGKGDDAVGKFKFKGNWESSSFEAKKHYSFDDHTIYYWGKVDDDLTELDGWWGFQKEEI